MQLNHEILVDYLDHQLSRESAGEVDTQVKENKAVASDLAYLKLAVDTVRRDAILQQVSAIRQSFEKNQATTAKASTGMIRNMYRMSMRVAAIIILAFGITFLYKYMSVSNQSVYDKQFIPYEISNTRGQEKTDRLSEAYQNKNWEAVITLYKTETVQSNKSSFLAAMSEMQLQHFSLAIPIFENLLGNSKKTGDNAFQEETEYYLSLAYLMNHEEKKAMQMMDKIRYNVNHTYYPVVSKISYTDLKIIELKK